MVGFLLFLAGCRFLNMLLIQDDMWTKILFRSYYTREKDIDYAFIGSSHVLCDVEPFLLDEINGGNNFNMSSPQQRYDTSYYLLKEMAGQNRLKHVYLECYYLCVTDHEIWDKSLGTYKVSDYIGDPDHFASAWLISDAMKLSPNSLAIRFHASDRDHTLENMIPFVRYREKLFDWDYMAGNLANRMSGEEPVYFLHVDYEEPDGSPWYQEYLEKGDDLSTGQVYDCEKIFPTDRDLTKYGIGAKSEEYLRKCIKFCQSQNIPVTVFVSPVLDFQLLSTGNYDNYVRDLKAIADEYGVDCYDFNLMKRDRLDIKHGEYYMDPEHLNTRGAELYTKVLWDVVSKTPEENQGLFYDSYADYLKDGEPEIFGLYYSLKDLADYMAGDGSPVYLSKEFTVASNRDDMLYSVTYHTNEAAEEEKNVEVSKEGTFTLPSDEHGTITISSSYEGRDLSLSVNF